MTAPDLARLAALVRATMADHVCGDLCPGEPGHGARERQERTRPLALIARDLDTTPEALADFDQSRDWDWNDLSAAEVSDDEAATIRDAWVTARDDA